MFEHGNEHEKLMYEVAQSISVGEPHKAYYCNHQDVEIYIWEDDFKIHILCEYNGMILKSSVEIILLDTKTEDLGYGFRLIQQTIAVCVDKLKRKDKLNRRME